ncbi:MAG: hypothetical protein LC776_10835 [Acidobacteria bacterium]|nr:hypothetical protein [Acidobacteriota bacterium]
MARDERQRQKKLAKRKTKRRKALLSIKNAVANLSSSLSAAEQVLRAAKAPIHECLVPEGLFQAGLGTVIVSRKLANGYIGVSTFLLDVFCLGVKNAFFRMTSEWEYENNLRRFKREENFQNVSPVCVRKLVEEAEAYARDLGFSPHPDYQLAKKIFGDIDNNGCPMNFEFGKDGLPFFVAGPHDTPEKSSKIINTLTKRCGPGGFHYMAALEAPFAEDFDDEEDDFDAQRVTIMGQPASDAEIPTHDFLGQRNLDDYSDLEWLVEDLISSLKNGYFLQWEAVIHEEQGLPLSKKQEEALSEIISFNDEADERVLYINEIPRPREPWYQIVRRIMPRLVIEPLRTYDSCYQAAFEGWPNLAECLGKYARDLSLPEGVSSPIDVVPAELQHRLWLQYCFDALCGLGQDNELTLENEEQHYRIEMFIESLREHIESVRFFNLTLETILIMVILPQKDEEIFIRLMLEALKMPLAKESIAEYL